MDFLGGCPKTRRSRGGTAILTVGRATGLEPATSWPIDGFILGPYHNRLKPSVGVTRMGVVCPPLHPLYSFRFLPGKRLRMFGDCKGDD